MKLYPFLCEPLPIEKIWGGCRIARELCHGTVKENVKIGETFELSLRREALSTVKNGALAGSTLASLEERFPGMVTGGQFSSFKSFPLLIKFIDAAEDLSVQVHPDDAYAEQHETECGKAEMWYIIDALPDSSIFLGLADGCTPESLFETDDPTKALKEIKVSAGEAYFIPAGTPHAIGKGILLAEVQQNSDLTYRIWDYDRQNGRELHREKARDVVKHTDCGRIVADKAGILVRFCGISVRLLDIYSSVRMSKDTFYSLLCVDGRATIVCDGDEYEISKGDSYFIPKALNELQIKGRARILVSAPDQDEV